MYNKVLSEEELAVLALVTSLKAPARSKYIELEGLGKYNTDNPVIQSLIAQKYLSINKQGAINHDRNRVRDTLKNYNHPQKYSLRGINSHYLFIPNTHPANKNI